MKNEVVSKYNIITMLNALTWAVANPVLFIFLISKGLTLGEAGLFFVIHSAAIVLGEIPTGAFADAYGRKKSAMASFAFSAIGVLLLIAGGQKHEIFLAAALIGMADSFSSGAIDAWAIDRLKERGQLRLSTSLFAGGHRIMLATLLFGGIMGGLVGEISKVFAVALGLPFALYGIFYCSRLPEKTPKMEFARAESSIMRRVAKALKECFSNPRLLALVAISGLAGAATFGLFVYWQPAFGRLFGWGAKEFGFLFAAMALAGIAGTALGERMAAKKYAFAITLACAGAFAMAAGFAWAAVPTLMLYLIFEVWMGAQNPIGNKLLHEEAKSSERATVGSIKNLGYRLGWAAAGLAIYLAGSPDLPGNWMISGAILIAAAAVAWKMGF